MQRRRNPFVVLALFAWLMQCQSGHTQVASWPPGPVDSGAEFRGPYTAAELANAPGNDVPTPAPTPEPAPALITTPTIEVPALTPLGEPIVATLRFDPPADSRVKVEWQTPTVATLPNGNWSHYIWAKPGKHTIGAMVVVVTADDIAVYSPTAELTVGDPPPPEPPKPLIQLVTPEQAPLLAGAYNALAQLADSFTSAEHFWANHDAYLQAKGLLSHGATEAVKLRLTPWDKTTLGATLAAISKEFGAPPAPPTPPVVEGKRRVVILRESGDDMPADARLYVQLRNDATAAYLKSKGHTLEIADATDNPLFTDGMPLPALLIFDSATGANVATLPRPATSAAILEAVKQHGG